MLISQIINKFLRIPASIINLLLIRINKVSIKKGAKIYGRLRIKNYGSISIGENTTINSHIRYNPIGFDSGTSFYVMKNAIITIGDNCGISNTSFFSKQRIVIEDNVLIGGGCKIYDTDFHSLDYLDRKDKQMDSINAIQMPILIKKNAFIGAGSIILKGVTIGEKSIIGAGSVVTKNVPDAEVWAGNPARFIRGVRND